MASLVNPDRWKQDALDVLQDLPIPQSKIQLLSDMTFQDGSKETTGFRKVAKFFIGGISDKQTRLQILLTVAGLPQDMLNNCTTKVIVYACFAIFFGVEPEHFQEKEAWLLQSLQNLKILPSLASRVPPPAAPTVTSSTFSSSTSSAPRLHGSNPFTT